MLMYLRLVRRLNYSPRTFNFAQYRQGKAAGRSGKFFYRMSHRAREALEKSIERPARQGGAPSKDPEAIRLSPNLRGAFQLGISFENGTV